MKQTRVIADTNSDRFSKSISKALQRGWVLTGELMFSGSLNEPELVVFVQQMAKWSGSRGVFSEYELITTYNLYTEPDEEVLVDAQRAYVQPFLDKGFMHKGQTLVCHRTLGFHYCSPLVHKPKPGFFNWLWYAFGIYIKPWRRK